MFIVCVKLLIMAYLSCSVSVSCEKGSRICDAFGGPFLQYASLNRLIAKSILNLLIINKIGRLQWLLTGPIF